MARPEVERGEIWLIDLGMVQKVRPALILSVSFLDHERALVTYVPRTTSMRQTRFEVVHQAGGFNLGAFDAQSIATIPLVKLVRRSGLWIHFSWRRWKRRFARGWLSTSLINA
jgi:mRNA interferase MazF